jgi:sugar phosphate isomerase/epimerase
MRLILGFLLSATGLSALLCNVPCAAAGDVGTGPSFKGPVGLQLYSLRDQFKKDVPGSLDEVKQFGIKYAELDGTYKLPAAQYTAMLAARGIKAIAMHFPFERLRDDAEGAALEAKALGLKYVGCAWIPHQGDFDEKTCRAAAAVFNRAGEVMASHGMKIFYHVHGYEFAPYGQGTLFDLLMSETKPGLVSYEMDVFWVVYPGQDPVKLFEKYGKRWELVHLKDMKKGTPTGPKAPWPEVTADVALGAGQIDMVPLLRAAKKAGVKWYFIEDESPSSEKQIPESLRFLEQVRW